MFLNYFLFSVLIVLTLKRFIALAVYFFSSLMSNDSPLSSTLSSEVCICSSCHSPRTRVPRPLRDVKPFTTLIYSGVYGSGKTSLSRYLADSYAIYQRDSSIHPFAWWSGYSGEPYILLDDIDGSTDAHSINELIGPRKYRGFIKGGRVAVDPLEVCLVSSLFPSVWNDGGSTPVYHSFCKLVDRWIHVCSKASDGLTAPPVYVIFDDPDYLVRYSAFCAHVALCECRTSGSMINCPCNMI